MVGKDCEVVLLQMPHLATDRRTKDVVPGGLKSEIWITSYPIPFEQKMLTLTE